MDVIENELNDIVSLTSTTSSPADQCAIPMLDDASNSNMGFVDLSEAAALAFAQQQQSPAADDFLNNEFFASSIDTSTTTSPSFYQQQQQLSLQQQQLIFQALQQQQQVLIPAFYNFNVLPSSNHTSPSNSPPPALQLGVIPPLKAESAESPVPATSSETKKPLKTKRTNKKQKVAANSTPSSTGGSSNNEDELNSNSDSKAASSRKRLKEQIEADNKRLNELSAKPNNSLTEQEKQEKRILRNRLSAQKSREQKRQERDSLEAEKDIIAQERDKYKSQTERLQQENDRLLRENTDLKTENTRLKTALAHYTGNTTIGLSKQQPKSVISIYIFLVAFLFAAGWLFYASSSSGSSIGSMTANYNVPNAPAAINRKLLNTSKEEVAEVRVKNEYEKRLRKQQQQQATAPTAVPVNIVKSNQEPQPATVKINPNKEILINMDDLTSQSTIYYPNNLKQHFEFLRRPTATKPTTTTTTTTTNGGDMLNTNKPVTITNSVSDSENETAAAHIIMNQNVVQQQQQGNTGTEAKQLMVPNLSTTAASDSSSVLGSPVMSKDRYDVAYLLKDEQDPQTGARTLLLFCPFAYPLLPAPGDSTSSSSSGSSGSNKLNLKILIPDSTQVKTVNNGQEFAGIIRVAEINTENVVFKDSYVAFPHNVQKFDQQQQQNTFTKVKTEQQRQQTSHDHKAKQTL